MLSKEPTNPSPNGRELIQTYRSMHRRIIDSSQQRAIVLDLKVVENPVLKDDEHYNTLRTRLKLYNRKVQLKEADPSNPPIDSYETETHNGLYRVLGEINAMNNKQIQTQRLKATKEWFDEQERLIFNRQAQGMIRYKTLRRRGMSLQSSPNKYEEPDVDKMVIPSEILAATMLPYAKKWRTKSHEENGIPSERVNDYKRKILNIQPIIEQKTMPLLSDDRASRILYPRPIKPVVEQQVKEEEKVDEENKQEGVPGEAGGEAGADVGVDEPPMLGEEPQEPEQPQEAEGDQDDKLAPKNKIYVQPISAPLTTRIPNDIEARGTFAFSQPDKCRAERAMQLRFKKLQDAAILQVKEDNERVEQVGVWSKGKSRMAKQLQKRLELIAVQPTFKYSEEQIPPPFCLSQEEQRKFNFSAAPTRSNTKEVDLSLQLPPINDRLNLSGYESTVEKSKLRDLKKRFSHMLNLTTDVEQRDIPKSLCQYSTRFKSFSAVLEEHSKEKQRSIQMEQVRSIKEKLTKSKLGVNITTLAHGLCLPDYLLTEQPTFPTSNLPSNPFMVEKKKKKKKK